MGSLSGLPYALAEAEQNFLVPTHTQALIWGDLVPQMMLTARTPRFWTVTPAQMHWVGVHMRYAESLIAEAALDPARRDDLAAAINRVASPLRTWQVNRYIASGDAQEAIDSLTPSELYWIAESMAGNAGGSAAPGSTPLAAEIAHLKAAFPDQVSAAAISRAWGTPKPTLANSYRPELLNLRTFPTLMGYSSRVMAESWESNQLYWADVGGSDGRAAGAVERAGAGVDTEGSRADFCVEPRRLAGAAPEPAIGRRRGAYAERPGGVEAVVGLRRG